MREHGRGRRKRRNILGLHDRLLRRRPPGRDRPARKRRNAARDVTRKRVHAPSSCERPEREKLSRLDDGGTRNRDEAHSPLAPEWWSTTVRGNDGCYPELRAVRR